MSDEAKLTPSPEAQAAMDAARGAASPSKKAAAKTVSVTDPDRGTAEVAPGDFATPKKSTTVDHGNGIKITSKCN